MRVWIDQDLCTGDGLCTDHCPEVFVLLEDGISYVRDAEGVAALPGGMASMVVVRARHEAGVIAAALDCPGDCIFVEPGDLETLDDEADIVAAEIVDTVVVAVAAGAGSGDGSFGAAGR